MAKVNIENLLTLLHIRQANLNLTVETTSTHQRLIQNVGAVCCRQHDYARIGLEAIHLGEHLVECVLTLVVAREARVLATRTTDGVNLVDENDTRSLLLCLLEEVSHSRCTHSDKHLYKVRARD